MVHHLFGDRGELFGSVFRLNVHIFASSRPATISRSSAAEHFDLPDL
jgi:hypothetical protein